MRLDHCETVIWKSNNIHDCIQNCGNGNFADTCQQNNLSIDVDRETVWAKAS